MTFFSFAGSWVSDAQFGVVIDREAILGLGGCLRDPEYFFRSGICTVAVGGLTGDQARWTRAVEG